MIQKLQDEKLKQVFKNPSSLFSVVRSAIMPGMTKDNLSRITVSNRPLILHTRRVVYVQYLAVAYNVCVAEIRSTVKLATLVVHYQLPYVMTFVLRTRASGLFVIRWMIVIIILYVKLLQRFLFVRDSGGRSVVSSSRKTDIVTSQSIMKIIKQTAVRILLYPINEFTNVSRRRDFLQKIALE